MMIHVFVEKALENLDAAKDLFEKGAYNASANRAYYASFQAAVAALAHEGLKKKGHPHDWVQAQFAGVLIRQKKLYSSSMKVYLSEMLEVREDADYSTKMVSRTDAREQLKKATELVNTVLSKVQE
jgi:uncharacterized protein (UPF0332 family)